MVSDSLAETWFRMSESTPDKKMAQVYLKNALRLAPDRVRNMLGEKTRAELLKQVERRNYVGAVASLTSLIDMQGWEVTLMQLQELSKDSVYSYEKAGDVLLHLLGLEFLLGLDIDPLVEFAGITGDGLESLTAAAKERAFDALKRQVEGGNTYYIDTEQLKELPFLLVLPDILTIREQEIHALSETPSCNEILSTYYGFMILTSAWSLERGLEMFTEMCSSLGKRIEVRTTRPVIREYLWRNQSPRMRTLLMQTARLCLSQSPTTQTDAIEHLGETGDARALQVLSEANTRVVDWEAGKVLKKTLEGMGGVYGEYESKKTPHSDAPQSRGIWGAPMYYDDFDEGYYESDEYRSRYDDEW
jgi:hypothetical protein